MTDRTQGPEPVPRASLWRSVWFAPRDTIERIVRDPRRSFLPLAILGGIACAAVALVLRPASTDLLDWRLAAIIVAVGATLGPLVIYIFGLTLRWSGRLLGGTAPASSLRAVAVWGGLPTTVVLIAYAFVELLLQLADASWHETALAVGAVVIVILIAAGWSLVASIMMIGRVQHFGALRSIANYALGWGLLFIVAQAFRALVFHPFEVPSGSMQPTLLVGDRFFVSKFSYGYSRFTLPFAPPLFAGRLFGSSPQHGDVVAFRLPRDDSVDYLQRVVGLPGDRIQMVEGALNINGAPVKREPLDDFVSTDYRGRPVRLKRWRETLPNGVSHETLDADPNGFLDNTPVFEVPPGHYFVMGDNRDNSNDSRVPATRSGVGFVPAANLVGRARLVYISFDREAEGRAPLRAERTLKRIQ